MQDNKNTYAEITAKHAVNTVNKHAHTNIGKVADKVLNGLRPKTRGGVGRIKRHIVNKPVTVTRLVDRPPPKQPRIVVQDDIIKEMVDSHADTSTKFALSKLEAPSIYHYSNYKAYLRAFEAYLKFLSRMNHMVNKFDHVETLRTSHQSLEDLSVDDTFCPVMTGVDSSLYDKVQEERKRKRDQQEEIRLLKIQLLQKSHNSSGVKVIQSSVETIKDTAVVNYKVHDKNTGLETINSTLTPMKTIVNTRRMIAPLESRDHVENIGTVQPGKVATESIELKPIDSVRTIISDTIYHKATSVLGKVIQDALHEVCVEKYDNTKVREDREYVDKILDKVYNALISEAETLRFKRKVPDLPLIIPMLMEEYRKRPQHKIETDPKFWTRVEYHLNRMSEVAKTMPITPDSQALVKSDKIMSKASAFK